METKQHEGEAFREWLKRSRIPVSEVADKLAITVQGVYTQLKNETVADSFKHKLSEAGLNFFKVENINIVSENAFLPYNAKSVNLNQGRANLTIVPLKAYGGFLTGFANRVFLDSLEQIPFPWIKGTCWGFEVEGYSMYVKDDTDSMAPGDIAICTELESPDWLVKNKIHVFVTIDGICIKLFDKIQDGKVYLRSANDEYNPVKPIPIKEVKKIYFKEYTLKK